jgi:hypothetical protein
MTDGVGSAAVRGRSWAAAPKCSRFSVNRSIHLEQLYLLAGVRSKWARARRLKLAALADEPWAQAPVEAKPGGPTLEAFRAVGLSGPKAC